MSLFKGNIIGLQFLYKSNYFYFKITIEYVFLHVGPTYPMVDFLFYFFVRKKNIVVVV
jgi:hypothetical protein